MTEARFGACRLTKRHAGKTALDGINLSISGRMAQGVVNLL